jgi:hypothetical protein
MRLERPPGARRSGAARGNRGNLQVARGDYAWSSPIWVKSPGASENRQNGVGQGAPCGSRTHSCALLELGGRELL